MDPIRFGRGIRELRQGRGWRQEDLARAAHVSRSVVARVEQGLGERVTHAALVKVAGALGARVMVRLDWNGEQLDRLIDARHASLMDLVVRELTAWGWQCATEVTFSVYGERGSIDILAFHPASGVLLVIEIKSSVPELGNTLIPLDRKVRLARQLAADRGWTARSVARLLVVEDGRSTRRRIAEHRAVFEGAFPVRGWAIRQWLGNPDPAPGWSGLWVPANDHKAVGRRRQRVRRSSAERGDGRQVPVGDRETVERRKLPS